MATKIQARYRGKVGRETAKKKEMKEQNNAATKMQANFRGHRARMQQAKEFAEQNNAATKIQAIHRGKKTRKSLNNSIKKEEEKGPWRINASYKFMSLYNIFHFYLFYVWWSTF